jgi:LmbE family N-acetylglucosaminyl deacetylase
MSRPVYLFISPHLDDVALSCGGYVRRLAAAGERVVIATVFTADVPAGTSLSWLMRRNHLAWRLGDAPFTARRREDIVAVGKLGAQYVHLGLLDAMYRRDAVGRLLYTKNSVRVPVQLDDWKNHEPIVRQRLQEVMRAHAGDGIQVFCPLTAGEHLDHIITRRAVETLCEPQRISYYEDYPYADQPGAVQARLSLNGRVENWQSVTIELTSMEIEARIAAVACYVSQVPGSFPSTLERWQEIARARLPVVGRYVDWPPDLGASRERMASSLRAYIARAGGERYWCRHYQSEQGEQLSEH